MREISVERSLLLTKMLFPIIVASFNKSLTLVVDLINQATLYQVLPVFLYPSIYI